MSKRRRLWILAGSAVLLLLAVDLWRTPERQWTAAALLGSIGAYQRHLSPALASAGVRCRFRPSCSHYSARAIRARGAFTGSFLTVWRILRCGPWTPAGTSDPPPAADAGPAGR